MALRITDGYINASLISDSTCSATLGDGRPHHVGFIVDGAAAIISVVVDGTFCDGGVSSPQGFVGFSRSMANVGGAHIKVLAGSEEGTLPWRLRGFRLYGRAPRTSEMIQNWRHGPLGQQ